MLLINSTRSKNLTIKNLTPHTMGNGMCTVCRWIAPLILAVTALLLLLLNLGVGMGAFGDVVMKWWPGGVLLYALAGFCPCHSCKAE